MCIVDYLRNGVVLHAEQRKGVAIGFIGIALVINNNLIMSGVFGVERETRS